VIGLFALVGAAGVIGSPLGGLLADRKGPRATMGVALVGTVVSVGVLTFLDEFLAAMVVGTFFFDMGVQTVQV
jgi:predicted MFS family arabinose efflux permease